MDADTRPRLNDPGGITVGALPDGRLLVDRHQMHVRLTGPTGAGKTLSFFMPTLMRSWKGSAVVHDRKGDFWLLLQGSSRWRHNLLFAPTLPDSVKYNPMARVGTGTDQIAGFQNLAALLPHSDTTQAKEPIWDENAKALATAEMMFLNNFGELRDRNLGGLRRFHGTGRVGGERMMRQQHPDPILREEIAASARRIWQNDNERYVGSILATIDSYLNVYADPNVAAATETCEFSPADLVCGPNPVLLNLYLPPEHSSRLAPLVRMLTSQILNALMGHQDKVGDCWKRHCMLFALDEFNRFGKVDAVEGAMADMRSYHCRAMLGAQSDGVLTTIYGEKSLIFNNSRLVALRPFDSGEADKLSRAIGSIEVTAESDSASYSVGGERRGGGLSRSRVRKPILPTEAVLRLSENDVLVCGYPKPIRVRRPPLSSWRTLVDPVPRSWSPLDAEFLPVRDDKGAYIDLPPAVGERNPWDDIRFDEPPPPEAPPKPRRSDEAGKPRAKRTPRTRVTVPPQEAASAPTPPTPNPTEDYPLMM
jgi:type IV secretion system protein VirD4